MTGRANVAVELFVLSGAYSCSILLSSQPSCCVAFRYLHPWQFVPTPRSRRGPRLSPQWRIRHPTIVRSALRRHPFFTLLVPHLPKAPFSAPRLSRSGRRVSSVTAQENVYREEYAGRVALCYL